MPIGVFSAQATQLQPRANSAATSFLATLGAPHQLASTVPRSGDLNPYGMAVVTTSAGHLVRGSTLISNFNAKSNVQGTGTTIMQVSASNHVSVFATVTNHTTSFKCPGGIGLTTALAILPGGWVVVGSLGANQHGFLPNDKPAGCLVILSNTGAVVELWSGVNLNGPWDMAATSTPTSAQLYVSDVMPDTRSTTNVVISENCKVDRLNVALHGGTKPTLSSSTTIGSGLTCEPNAATFVEGPTGIAIGANGTAYVAETLANNVMKIPSAATRTTALNEASNVFSAGGSLDNPLGVIMARNGDVLVANANNGNVVEIAPNGKQLATRTLVKNGSGALFGLSLSLDGKSLLFVNDATNALDVATGR